jgi:hypothetical protein
VTEDSVKIHSRRELFAGALRYAALGLLTAGGVTLFAKRRRLLREGKCIGGGVCGGCKLLENCGLPQASSAREASAGVENGRR